MVGFLRISAFLFVLSFALPCYGTEEALLDSNALTQLELRAQQAKPREQCFLYAELIHGMTELAGHQILAGDIDHANESLKRIERYARLIHLGLAHDTKRLMNAQLLMHHTTRRLDEYVRKASFEDRETLQTTLKQLTQVEDELLSHVFAH